MALFPFTAPRLGLHLDAAGFSLVEVRRSWWARGPAVRLRDCIERSLPEGLIRPSATEPNVADVAALAGALRDVLGARRGSTVALTLPDQCARMGLVEFESLPKNQSECQALITWRIQQELNLPATDTRLAFRIFRPQRVSASPPRVVARVLAVAIRQPVLEQYEQVCERVSLWPVSVGLTSPRLFDLCRPAMVATAGQASEEAFFASIGEREISFVAFRHGCPVFLRHKAIRNGADADRPRQRLAGELVATLQYYADVAVPSPDLSDVSRPLFLVGDPEPALLDPQTAESLRVRVVPIGRDVMTSQADRVPRVVSLAGLAALAGVTAA